MGKAFLSRFQELFTITRWYPTPFDDRNISKPVIKCVFKIISEKHMGFKRVGVKPLISALLEMIEEGCLLTILERVRENVTLILQEKK